MGKKDIVDAIYFISLIIHLPFSTYSIFRENFSSLEKKRPIKYLSEWTVFQYKFKVSLQALKYHIASPFFPIACHFPQSWE